nr:beta-N-acetylhexosaminidase [Allomuricauda sp.]
MKPVFKKFVLILLLIFNSGLHVLGQLPVIPYPSEVEHKSENFIASSINCFTSIECMNEALFLVEKLHNEFGVESQISTKKNTSNLRLTIEKDKLLELGEEGYELQIFRDIIEIKAPTSTGIFYGIQSLLQLIQKNSENSFMVSGVKILDKPRFAWRAFLLDEARRFKGMDMVKELLDEMAFLKMNTFHWHLTDDQGWRIQIKQYPKLITVGSKRNGSKVSPGDKSDGMPHEGYYTQEEIKEIVDYAASRHIKIIPEIEMPGHASAAIASYPWLGAKGEPLEIPEALLAVYPDIYNVADPEVRTFLKNVVDEVIALFPSGIVHIGGDEVKYGQWKDSGQANQFIKEHNLKSPADLHLWFTNNMSSYISKKGYRMIGWNDITGNKIHDYIDSQDVHLGRKLDQQTIVQFWKGDPKLIEETAKKGYDIVNSYHVYTYLDYSHESIGLEKAYSFEPVPEELPISYHSKILGLGCQMWSQAIPTRESMHLQIFPRIAAYAEVGWTQKKNKDYTRFKSSLLLLKKIWKRHGINYYGFE